MNDFDELLSPDGVAWGISVPTKADLFAELSARAAPICGVDPDVIHARLDEREAERSTGFGGGVAIPHGRLPGIERAFGIFMRLSDPIDYGAVDDMPVDCVFALFSPLADSASHLRALARISRKLHDARFLAKLRGARSEQALLALLSDHEAADAA